MTVTTTRPQMKIVREQPRMKVNWKKVWAERGQRSPEHFRKHTVQLARQLVQESIHNIVSQGNYLGDLPSYYNTGINPVGQWQYQEMMSDIPELQMAQPISSPEVEWTDGDMTIEWTKGEIEIVWDEDFTPEITVTPYSVEIRLRDHSEVKIAVNEDNIRKNSGGKVDKKV